MIRAVLIFTYILVVLLISGLARAEYAPVTKVEFNQSNFLLHIQGVFANSCQHHPQAKVVDVVHEQQADSVYIAVVTDQPAHQMCGQIVNGKYDLVMDVRSLNLPVGKKILLRFKGSENDSRTNFETVIANDSVTPSAASFEKEGELVETHLLGFGDKQPGYALVSADGSAVAIKTLVDLSGYVHQRVLISGLPLNMVVNPVSDTTDLNYELNKELSGNLSLIFVTGISSVPLQLTQNW